MAAQQDPPDDRSFTGWALKGLDGALNLCLMIAKNGGLLTPHFGNELLKVSRKFSELLATWKERQDG